MSSITAIWTTDRTKARANSYEQICITCGNPVPVMKGQLVSLSSSDGTALRNGALHSYCELSNGYRFRAKFGQGMEYREIVSDDFAKGIPDPIEPAKPEPLREPTEDELAKAVSDIMAGTTAAFLEAVPGLVRATLMDLTRTVEIKLPKTPAVKIKVECSCWTKLTLATPTC
jgi:hypothetical protein